ncbi:MAG: hypothetical protein JXA95_19265 [Spirochaetales bacterium]|nr:hypothetical protein [Spirochaetales bacterium]
MRLSPAKSFFPLLLLLLPAGLFGLTWLEGDFSISRDFTYFVKEGEKLPVPPPPEWSLSEGQKTLYRTLLEEVRFLYSLRIYGARFHYIPGDTRDGVEDLFEWELTAELEWGDPSLSVTGLWFEGDDLFIHVRYRLSPTQAARMDAWESPAYPVSGGWGEVSLLSEDSCRESVRMAARQSVRNYWQPREYDRPREISGQFFLRDFPRFAKASGMRRASLMCRFRFDPIVSYP